jgi:hypothetical protein
MKPGGQLDGLSVEGQPGVGQRTDRVEHLVQMRDGVVLSV